VLRPPAIVVRARVGGRGDALNENAGTRAWSEVTELGDGLWAIDTAFKRPLFDASHLIVENGRAAFVDVATSYSIPRLLAALKDRGLSPADVDYVILTHVHLDHSGGAGALMRRLPTARLVVHPRGARHVIDPTKLIAGASAVFGEEAVRKDYGEVLPVDAERVVEARDGFVLEVGGRPLHFIDAPGHARHHVCIWDEASRAWFAGDTFGLAYPELASERGVFIFPTTTPVQFDPDHMAASVDRMLRRSPRAMLLTHYSRVTDVERLARELLAQVAAFVAMAREADRSADRSGRLRAVMGEYLLDRALDHGSPKSREEVRQALAHDVELNAQGLEVWLDKMKGQ
jgi:glyoxylase-like metal-dependent hydrolase (beta-lactamase superfamily II)